MKYLPVSHLPRSICVKYAFKDLRKNLQLGNTTSTPSKNLSIKSFKFQLHFDFKINFINKL